MSTTGNTGVPSPVLAEPDGRPTVELWPPADVYSCEACGRRPASHAVTFAAGDVFLVCDGCAEVAR